MLLLLSCGLPAQTSAPKQTHSNLMSAQDQARLHTALDAYDAGQAAQAEPILQDLTRRYPANYEASEALGSLYAEKGDVSQALPFLKHAVEVAPRQALAHANLGAVLIKSGKNAEAIVELQKATALDSTSAVAYSNLGRALMAAKKPADAAVALTAASRLAPDDADLKYDLALALYDSGSAASAAKAAAVLATLPAAAMTDQVHALAADAEERAGHFKEALTHFQAAAHMNPSDANLYALDVELLRHWTWAEAVQVAEFGATRYPASTHFKAAEGIALYGDNKYPEAVKVFGSLLAKEPENALYADLLGRSCSLITEGASDECKGLEEFVERHPENARAALYAATSILHRPTAEQDTAKVERLLHQALGADPKLTEAYYQMGVLEQQRSQWKESAAVLEKAVQLRPSYPEAHYRLSRAYAHLGMQDEARKQIVLQQQYAQQEKDHLNSRMQEVATFLLKAN